MGGGARTAYQAGALQAIGQLLRGLTALGQRVNLVIVADHGMAAVSEARVVRLDRFADPADFVLVEDGPFASFNAVAGHESALEATIAKAPEHVQCWPKAQIPARFRYGQHPRVPAYLCLAETGWLVLGKESKKAPHGGTHGFDNLSPDMAALFIATGPSIRQRATLPAFDNVDVEPLIRDLIGLPARKERDGDDAPFRKALKR